MLPQLSPQASGFSAFQSQEYQQLNTRTVDYDLHIQSGDGRELRVNLDWSQLQYERTYSATGTVYSQTGKRGDDARVVTAGESLQQASVFEHERFEQSKLNLEIEGDMSLLQEYFGAENTAQRIFDHVSGLLGNMGADSAGFSDAMDQIMEGVADGFEQAQALFPTPLPKVSQDTRTLLDGMLNDLRETGNRGLSVFDYLDLLSMHDEDEQ